VSSGTSISAQGEGFVFAEDKPGTLCFLRCGLSFERGEAIAYRQLGTWQRGGGQFELHLFPMAGADFDVGVKRTRCDLQPQPLGKEPGHRPIRPPLSAEFPDQFAVRF
jgi:hypothetical protein